MIKHSRIDFNTRWVVIAGGTTDLAPVHDLSFASVMDWRSVGGSAGNDYPTSIKAYILSLSDAHARIIRLFCGLS